MSEGQHRPIPQPRSMVLSPYPLTQTLAELVVRFFSIAEYQGQRVHFTFQKQDEPKPIFQELGTTWFDVIELQPHWDEYNETNGICRGRWFGFVYDFWVFLVDDEWTKVPIGGTWIASVSFSCLSPVCIGDAPEDDLGLKQGGLTQVESVRYEISGRLLRQIDEQQWLVALPHHVVLDLDHSRCEGLPLLPGRWITAQGILQARMPE